MAERVPFFTLFESFQAPRQLRLLLHDACIISGALDMAGRTLEVQVESSAADVNRFVCGRMMIE